MLIVGIIWGVYGLWILIISWYYGTNYGIIGTTGLIYYPLQDAWTI